MTKLRTRITVNYHWIIAAVLLLELTVYGGVANNENSLFLIPITEDLSISRSTYSVIMSSRQVITFLGSLICGSLFLKFGSRRLVPVGILLSALGLGMMAGTRNLGVLAVGAAMSGISGVVCSVSSATRVTGAWFHRHHGLILGIVTAGTGLGGSAFCKIFSNIIEKSGWQQAYFFASLMYVVAAAIIFLLLRNRPRDMKLKPYGEGYVAKKSVRQANEHWEGFSMAELKKKPMLYLFLAGTFLSCLGPYMAYSVIPAHVQDCGMGADVAATVQSLMLLSLAAAKLFFGLLCDKIGPRRSTMLCLGICTVSLVLLSYLTGPVSAYIVAILYATCLPLTTMAFALLLPDLFGYRAVGAAAGIVQAMVPAASVSGSNLTNVLFDRVGSYKPIFLVTAAFMLAVIALYFVLFRSADRAGKQMERELPQ